jgi:hypothetical protein
MNELRIDVSDAPEGRFSLIAAMHFMWTLLIGVIATTMLSIPILISERYEYLFVTFGLALIVWCWLMLFRPWHKQARIQAYGRSLGQIRSALSTLRGGADRSRHVWLATNLGLAAAAVAAGIIAGGRQADWLWPLAILFGLNGLRLWSDKSNSLKALGAWILIAIVWLGSIAIWGSLFADRDLEDDLTATLSLIVWSAALVLAMFATRRIAPWSQATMEEMRARDRRPPVLFLRSFNDEAEPILKSGQGPTLERVLTDSVRAYGPFIGIGRPGELRPAGAARKYLPDDQWQAAVLGLMDEAAFIIVLPGLTPGLDWEMQRLAERGRLRKTIFVLPPRDRTERCARLRDVLAETPEGARMADHGLAGAMSLHLTRDWRWAVIQSQYISYADYQAAIDVSVYGLLCADR